jgi:hypothetical protein
MDVDEPWRHDAAIGVDRCCCAAWRVTQCDYLAAADADIANVAGSTTAIDNPAANDLQVIVHRLLVSFHAARPVLAIPASVTKPAPA